MSGQDETMRLIAEVVDRFSGPLKDLNKAMGTINSAGKRMNAEGAKQTREHAKAYHELHEKIGKAKEMVAGVLSPALAALGITGFAAGEAVSKLVENLKSAAENYHKLNDAARRLGGSVDDVNEIVNAYGSWGIAADKASGYAAALGFHMDRLRRGNSEELSSWHHLGGALQALWPALAKTKSNFEALQVARDFQNKNHVPVDQMTELYGFLGQPAELATKDGEEYAEAFEKAVKERLAHPDNAALNKGLAKAFDDLGYSLKGFSWEMNEAFGSKSVKLIETLSYAIDGMGGVIKTAAEKVHSFFTEFDHIASKPAGVLKKWLDSPSDKSKPSTYTGSGGVGAGQPGWSPAQMLGAGMQPVSYSAGGDPETMLSQGVKTGMLAAFREWFASTGAGGSGYQKANYSDGPPSSTKSAAAIASSFGNRDFPNTDGGGPAGVSPSENNDGGNAGATSFDRARFAKEIEANPALKEKIFQLAAGEDRPSGGESAKANQAVMETMMNRAAVRHTTLAAQAKWYGREKGGYYAGKPSRLSAHEREVSERNLAAVIAGANTTDYATDNSSQGLAAREKASGKFIFHKAYHGESFFSPGWAEPALRDRYAKMRKDDLTASADKARGVSTDDGSRWVPPSGPQDRAASFKERFGELLPADKSKVNHTVTGDASLNIALNGFPKGTKTDLTYGGLFTSYNLSRGRQMEQSEQK
jgi:hypothetical protein